MASARAGAAQGTSESERIHASAAKAIREFSDAWLYAWARSEAQRHSVSIWNRATMSANADGTIGGNRSRRGYVDSMLSVGRSPLYRSDNIACRRDDERWGNDRSDLSSTSLQEQSIKAPFVLTSYGRYGLIPSRFTGFSVCPTWFQGPGPFPAWDERLSIDGALTTEYREKLRFKRDTLIELLRQLSAAAPTDAWLLGQHIRFLVDQHRLDDASRVLSDCAAERWWCRSLAVYVDSHRERRTQNQRLLEEALTQMTTAQRCQWLNVAPLVDSAFRQSYDLLPCASRDSLNTIVWWLSDPLWSESGNERLKEQFSRRALMALRSSMDRDERFDWRHEAGGDAREEMMLRYGWPSMMYWRGLTADSIRSGYLRLQPTATGGASPANVPYVSYEYSAGRTHLVPSAHALWNPFAANTSDWSIRGRAGGDSVLHYENRYTIDPNSDQDVGKRLMENHHLDLKWHIEQYPSYARSTLWWPREHYAASRSLAQLADPEVALLRRERAVLLGVAVALDPAASALAGTASSSQASLVLTPHPDTISIAASSPIEAGKPIVMQAEFASRPVMLGVEYLIAPDSTRGARTRLGITPPLDLAAMSTTDRAVSNPVLIDAATANIARALEANIALKAMRSSSTFTRGSAIGLYWETYGYALADPVQISLRVERTDSTTERRGLLGAFRRESQTSPIVITWSEAGSSPRARTLIDGRVPVIGRTIAINTRSLPAGEYVINVAISAAGHPISVGSKAISVSK